MEGREVVDLVYTVPWLIHQFRTQQRVWACMTVCMRKFCQKHWPCICHYFLFRNLALIYVLVHGLYALIEKKNVLSQAPSQQWNGELHPVFFSSQHFEQLVEGEKGRVEGLGMWVPYWIGNLNRLYPIPIFLSLKKSTSFARCYKKPRYTG